MEVVIDEMKAISARLEELEVYCDNLRIADQLPHTLLKLILRESEKLEDEDYK